MSIRSSVFYWHGVHLFKSIHDGWYYVDVGEWQVWPPAVLWPAYRFSLNPKVTGVPKPQSQWTPVPRLWWWLVRK